MRSWWFHRKTKEKNISSIRKMILESRWYRIWMAGLGCCLVFRITIVSQKHVCLSGSLYTYCESIFIRGYSDTEEITVFECLRIFISWDSFFFLLIVSRIHIFGVIKKRKPSNKKSSVFLKKISKIRFDILCITFKPPEMPALKVVI